MGVCLSARTKAEIEYNTGEDSKNVSISGKDMGSTSGKISLASVLPTPRSEDEISQSTDLKSFSFAELRVATRNFRPDTVLKEGAFCSFFKGRIDEHSITAAEPGTGMDVTVKICNQDGSLDQNEWLAEVNFVGQLSHFHLVKLIGYCLEDEHRLLVYEFAPRGSLENHLFQRGYFQPLPWSLRLKVALGAAKGLAFLHGNERKVIYRDFKTSKILLDYSYNVKLSDFGLPKDNTTVCKGHENTGIMGTNGYTAPEYFVTGNPTTTLSDVFSFGVVLLEMLSGKRVIDKNRPCREQNLVGWAKPYLANKRKMMRVIDHRLEDQYSLDVAYKVSTLTLRCLSIEPKFRPSMNEVVKELEQLQDFTHSNNGNSTNKHQARRHSADDAKRGRGAHSYPRPSGSSLDL